MELIERDDALECCDSTIDFKSGEVWENPAYDRIAELSTYTVGELVRMHRDKIAELILNEFKGSYFVCWDCDYDDDMCETCSKKYSLSKFALAIVDKICEALDE